MPNVELRDLKQIPYQAAWDLQQSLFDELLQRKERNVQHRDAQEPLEALKHYLLFCEHPHVYTLGRNGDMSNLLLDEQGLLDKQAEFFKIRRGGDITYHGPGQLVGYPIFDLEDFVTDIARLVRNIEEAVIRTCAEYNVIADRLEGVPGVWIDPHGAGARKICAVGLHLSRWVTMHGFAFNVNSNLEYFQYIVPCGITDKGVTSLQKELGREMDMAEVKVKVLHHLKDLFGFEVI